MTSPRKTANSPLSGAAPLVGATIRIKCSFCGNTFYARLKDAVCPKCERPANRDLPALWRALSLLVPPFGFAYAAWIRPHSPLAALQGLKWSLGGALIWAALALSPLF